jgi:type III secretory pathway component EscR
LTSFAIARRVRLTTVAGEVALILALAASPAAAQDISINLGQGGGLTERVIQQVALLTVLSLAPSILVMMTSFTRIVVVSPLRTALGTATAPPNVVIIALALFLTAFVTGPALQRSYDEGILPLANHEITLQQAFDRSTGPLRIFMQKNVREKDLQLFSDLSTEPRPATPADMSEIFERSLNKLARTYTTQLETLKRYRTGGEQKVTVRHVLVNDGGQAIVGNVAQAASALGKPAKDTPALTDARQTPMEIIGQPEYAPIPLRGKQEDDGQSSP